MPDWKTHLIFSLFFVVVLVFLLQRFNFDMGFEKLFWLVSLSVFTSLFPDIDVRISKIRAYVSILLSISICLWYVINFQSTWYYAPVYFILLYLILKYLPTKHRGITHTVEFAVLFSSVMALIYLTFNNAIISINMESLTWFGIVFSNYFLHLILDRI